MPLKKKKHSKKKSSSFTILEICICMVILGLASSIVIWQVKGLLDRHKLYNTAHCVVSQLRELQSIAMSYQRDMELELIQKKDGIAYRQKSDEPLTGFSQKEVSLNDGCELIFDKKPSPSLKFSIYSSGRIEPLGKLEVRRKDMALYIHLDRPLLITLSDKE